jgi:hypothetical protein
MSKNMDINFNLVQSTWESHALLIINGSFYLYHFEQMPMFGINENMWQHFSLWNLVQISPLHTIMYVDEKETIVSLGAKLG